MAAYGLHKKKNCLDYNQKIIPLLILIRLETKSFSRKYLSVKNWSIWGLQRQNLSNNKFHPWTALCFAWFVAKLKNKINNQSYLVCYAVRSLNRSNSIFHQKRQTTTAISIFPKAFLLYLAHKPPSNILYDGAISWDKTKQLHYHICLTEGTWASEYYVFEFRKL